MIPRYDPATHDHLLTELNQKWRLTDAEIGDRLQFDKRTIQIHRKRLGLPLNHAPKGVKSPTEKDGYAPPAAVNPITVALQTLGSRVTVRQGGYFLDNRPVSTKEMVQIANKIRKRQRLEPVGPKEWQ